MWTNSALVIGSVHLRRSIACIILFNDAIGNCVRNVAVIPIHAAVFQVDLTLMLHLIERGGELDRLRDSQCAVWLELRLCNAVDETCRPRALHTFIVPCRLRNIDKRKLFFLSFRFLAYAGVRANRLDGSTRGLRRLVQLRDRYICNCFRSICILEFAAALAANPVFNVAVRFCCWFCTVDMIERMTNCRDCDGIQNILAAFIQEVLTAVVAVPMFFGSGLRAGCVLGFHMRFVCVRQSGENVLPSSATVRNCSAVPQRRSSQRA